MNCSQCRELLVGYIEELLDAGQTQAVKSHLETCADCRKELEQITSLQNRLVASGDSQNQNDLENAVMDRIVREQAFKLRKTKEEKQHLNFWRTFMKNRITQLAAAAVIIIAVTLGVYYFMGFGTKPCMAWDCIIRPIMDANTAEFDIIIGEEGKTPVIHEMVMGSKIRRSMEGMEGAKIIDLETMRTLALFPQTKTAVYIEPLKERPQIPNYLVQIKDAIKTLQNTPGFVVEELGQKDIDGQISYGFEAKHPQANIVIYVDPATALPVRIEQESGQMKMIYKNMRFDVPIDETLFSMDAPVGYKIEQQKMDMRGSTEEDFIEGLRIQAEVFGEGQFPDDVSIEHFIKMMPTMHEKVDKLQVSDEQGIAWGMKIQKGMMFIRFFKGEGKWVYAGKGVKLGDANTAIFWYRPVGSQTYHVIYGDLSVKDVTEADLPRPADKQ